MSKMYPKEENTGPVSKIQEAIVRGYNKYKLPLPPDFDQKIEEGYDSAFEKKYNKEQELVRRAHR